MRHYLMLCDPFCYDDTLLETECIHILQSMHTYKRTKEHSPWLNAASFTPHPPYPREIASGIHWIVCCVVFNASLDALEKKRNSLLLSETEPRYFSRLIHHLDIHNDWAIPHPTAYGHTCKKWCIWWRLSNELQSLTITQKFGHVCWNLMPHLDVRTKFL